MRASIRCQLASLLLLEDVKHEQLLMLTFSRAAATEFKQRLMELIGNAFHVELLLEVIKSIFTLPKK